MKAAYARAEKQCGHRCSAIRRLVSCSIAPFECLLCGVVETVGAAYEPASVLLLSGVGIVGGHRRGQGFTERDLDEGMDLCAAVGFEDAGDERPDDAADRFVELFDCFR